MSPEVAPQPQAGSLYRQPPQEEVPPQPQGEASGFKPFQPANADALDEELLVAFRQQNEHFAEQFQQQEERFASELRERDETARAQQKGDYESRFDQAVQKLGDDWQDVFGKGDGSNLAHAGQRDPAAMTAVNHRVMLFSAVEAVREANQKQGFAPMDLEQELQWALMQRYPDKFQQQLRRNFNAQAQGRRGTQASRPTARKTPLGTKNDRILSNLHGKYPTGGFDQNDEEFDGEV